MTYDRHWATPRIGWIEEANERQAVTKPIVYYTWECPNCQYTYESPTVIAGISHLCRDRKRRLLRLATTAHPRGVGGDSSLEVGDYRARP